MSKTKSTKLIPLGFNVVIKPVETEEKTKTGIILPDTADKEQPQIGKIIALGSKIKKSEIKVGDKVLFEKYGMEEIEIGDQKLLIGLKSKILAKIK